MLKNMEEENFNSEEFTEKIISEKKVYEGMEALLLIYLANKKELLCEEWLFSRGIMVFEYQDDGKTYFRIRMGTQKAHKNIVVSLQDILVFLFEYKQDRPIIHKFQSHNTNL